MAKCRKERNERSSLKLKGGVPRTNEEEVGTNVFASLRLTSAVASLMRIPDTGLTPDITEIFWVFHISRFGKCCANSNDWFLPFIFWGAWITFGLHGTRDIIKERCTSPTNFILSRSFIRNPMMDALAPHFTKCLSKLSLFCTHASTFPTPSHIIGL